MFFEKIFLNWINDKWKCMFSSILHHVTTDGTMISNLREFAAFRTAFATVFGSSDVGEYFGIFSNEG